MGKNIVLCSDGTGNRWGVGAQTNVSKLYEAVDTEGSPCQIRFYDNGVGTSSNKYLKAVTGAFGLGLQQNIRDLYEFLARHWQPGDRIYLYGFSRGAATVRGFAGMLQECGLLWIQGDNPDCKDYDQKRFGELVTLALEAYRQHRRKPKDPQWNLPHKKRFRESVVDSAGGFNVAERVEIRMLGVWDTVSALGFPKGPLGLQWLFKILEWLANSLFPHRFYDYRLDDRVEHACHALAIDDERRSFRPTVWNETEEPRPAQVEQVWFAGMHSNVGGGYARTGLSSVALVWMMAHAQRLGLALRPRAVAAAMHGANPQGKMHDSRDGFGVFYRYMPRDLVRLCEKGVGPTRRRGLRRHLYRYMPWGLIRLCERWRRRRKVREGEERKLERGRVKIHRSVLERLQDGAAGYAPGLLPRSFEVVDDPLPEPGTQVQSGTRVRAAGGTVYRWRESRRRVMRWTRRRSLLYHLFLYLTLALVSWTLWLPAEPEAGGVDGSVVSTAEEADPAAAAAWPLGGLFDWSAGVTAWICGKLAGLLKGLLPSIAEGGVDLVFIEKPVLLLLILIVAVALFVWRGNCLKARFEACQQARVLILEAWARVNGCGISRSEVTGRAQPALPDSRRYVRGLILALIVVVLVMGMLRLSFP